MTNNLSCPIDHITVHETRVRLTALLVFLAALSYLFIGYWWIVLPLLFSFLESAIGFCAGCYVYSFLKRIFPGFIA